jgi:hypothetical protein
MSDITSLTSSGSILFTAILGLAVIITGFFVGRKWIDIMDGTAAQERQDREDLA